MSYQYSRRKHMFSIEAGVPFQENLQLRNAPQCDKGPPICSRLFLSLQGTSFCVVDAILNKEPQWPLHPKHTTGIARISSYVFAEGSHLLAISGYKGPCCPANYGRLKGAIYGDVDRSHISCRLCCDALPYTWFDTTQNTPVITFWS